jgi:hypothetical protein
MAQRTRAAGCILLVLFGAPLFSQSTGEWKVPSPHIVRFISVDKSVSWKCSIEAGPADLQYCWPEARKRFVAGDRTKPRNVQPRILSASTKPIACLLYDLLI